MTASRGRGRAAARALGINITVDGQASGLASPSQADDLAAGRWPSSACRAPKPVATRSPTAVPDRFVRRGECRDEAMRRVQQ
jgi:hypothetical protein